MEAKQIAMLFAARVALADAHVDVRCSSPEARLKCLNSSKSAHRLRFITEAGAERNERAKIIILEQFCTVNAVYRQ